jgi:hypothetical protein
MTGVIRNFLTLPCHGCRRCGKLPARWHFRMHERLPAPLSMLSVTVSTCQYRLPRCCS